MKKMKTQLAVLFGVVALFFASCMAPAEAPKPIDMDALKAEIQKAEDAFAAGELAKDADAVVAYYSDDAVSYSRNEEPASGKAAIKERIKQRLAKDTTNNHSVYKVIDLFAEGSMAVEIGSFTSLSPAGAEVEKGYYLSYFQKRDGKYLCVRDMNITTKPEKAGM